MAAASDKDDILAASERWERRLRQGWARVLAWLRAQWSVAEVETMLASREFQALLADLERGAASLAAVAADAYEAGGKLAALTVERATGDPVLFGRTNERAVVFLRRERLRLVREVTASARETWTEVIAEGMQRGANPREVAREIRASLGLTQRQQAAVANFRRLLQQGSAEALTRELRDRRFDSSIRRAIKAGKPLTSAEIEKMVERYRQRYIAYRAEVIARTEALRAVHEGAEEAYRQALDEGDIRPQDVERTWVIAGGVTRKGKPRTRHSHRAMRNQKRPLGEPFRSGYGYMLRYPGDLSAPASETVQCRCVVATRVRPTRHAEPAVTVLAPPVPTVIPPPTLHSPPPVALR